MIYYIVTHLSGSLFPKMTKPNQRYLGEKEIPEVQKLAFFYMFQETYIQETMFSCHFQQSLRVDQSYIIIN